MPNNDIAKMVARRPSRHFKEPQNRSRIVIDGIDEPKRGDYHDRIKIDPFAPGYISPVQRKPIVRT